MVIVNIQGGLGNQMFEYAFAYSASMELNTSFVLDEGTMCKLQKYFDLVQKNNDKSGCFYKLGKWFLYNALGGKNGQRYVDYRDCWKEPWIQLKNWCYYDGYFQSVDYFNKYENEIRQLFRLKKEYEDEFMGKYGMLFEKNKTIVVHVRRGDYLTFGKGKNLGGDDLSLPITYYKRVFEQIENVKEYVVIVIGDDEKWNRENFNFLENVRFESNSEIVDFQLLKNADVCVMSNGSYAWWGCFLNEKSNKVVYAPKNYVGFRIGQEYPNGIYNGLNYRQIEI